MRAKKVTYEERQLMAIYNPGTRRGLLKALIDMQQYLSKEERDLAQIQCRMQEYGTSNMSAFIRKMAIDGYIVKLELPELKEMTRLLASYSNNLNQIAKRVNATSNLYSADIEEIHRQPVCW